MAEKNSWSSLRLDDPDTRAMLAQIGAKKLSTGEIPVDHAKALAQNMGLLPKDDENEDPQVAGPDPASPLAMNPQASSPVSMAGMYAQAKQVGKAKGAKGELQHNVTAMTSNKNTSSTGTRRDVYKDYSEYQKENQMAGGINPDTGEANQDDPITQQRQGVDRLQQLLAMSNEANRGRANLDLSPVAALADSWNAHSANPTNLAASTTKPEDMNGKFMAYADEIQKRRADIQKSIMENRKSLKAGTDTTAQSAVNQAQQTIINKMLAAQNNPTYDRQQAQTDRMDQMTHNRVINSLKNDKTLRDRLVQYQNLSNSVAAVNSADHLSTQQFDELQQAVRANLGIKGSSGVGERERTQLNSLDLALTRLKQFGGGKIEDVPADNPLLQHVLNLAKVEQTNVHGQMQSRLNAVASGAGSMYARRPDLEGDRQDTMRALMDQVPEGKETPKAAPKTQAEKVTGAPASGGFNPDAYLSGGK